MKYRWMGVTGLALILASLILGSLGPSLWPTAFWSGQSSPMMGLGITSGGMMGQGPIVDQNAPFDQRFLDQMIVHHRAR